MESALMAHVDTQRITREQLALVPTPPGTATHRPILHNEIVDALVETLGFRHIGVHNMEFAVSEDGNKCFGLIEMEHGFTGARFALDHCGRKGGGSRAWRQSRRLRFFR